MFYFYFIFILLSLNNPFQKIQLLHNLILEMLSHLKISQKKQSVDLPLPPVLGMGSKASERKKSVDILPESICPNQMSRRRKSVDVFWPLDPGPTAKSTQEEKIEADVVL